MSNDLQVLLQIKFYSTHNFVQTKKLNTKEVLKAIFLILEAKARYDKDSRKEEVERRKLGLFPWLHKKYCIIGGLAISSFYSLVARRFNVLTNGAYFAAGLLVGHICFVKCDIPVQKDLTQTMSQDLAGLTKDEAKDLVFSLNNILIA